MDMNSVGILYMGFGAKAATAISRSMASLRKIGLNIPVCVVGDNPTLTLPNWGGNVQLIQWGGESPFDAKQRTNFQFRAGRIKPLLYKFTPFERTLYIDADTTFIRSIADGFNYLDEYDIVATEEKLTLAGLYNKKLAGWEINIRERDVTVIETGGDANRKFINSGVLFFRKNEQTEKLFDDWHSEWMRFQEWDEQLALIRAIHNNKDVKVKCLSVEWNDPYLNKNTIIFHNYGRGVVRTNVR